MGRPSVVLKDPKTAEWDFNSVARVVAFSELEIGFFYQNEAMHDVVRTVFEGEQYSLAKRCDLLRLWRRYSPIRLVTEQILRDSEKHPNDLVEAAFIGAAEFPGEAALKYVERMLVSKTAAALGPVAPWELIGFAFRTDALNEAAWKWIHSDAARTLELHPLLQASAAAGICSDLETDQSVSHRYSGDDRTKATRRATELLAGALAAGVQIQLHPNRLEIKFAPTLYYRANSRAEYSTSIENLYSWLGCETVVNAALKQRAVTLEALTSSVQALQATYQGREIAAITADLKQGGSISIVDGTILTSLDTNEPVLLRIKASDGTQLWASWRTRNGKYEEGRVVDADCTSMSFAYRYDRDRIYEYVYMLSGHADESVL